MSGHSGPPIPRRPDSSFSATSLRKNRLAPTPPPRSSGTRADLPAHHQLRACTPSRAPRPRCIPRIRTSGVLGSRIPLATAGPCARARRAASTYTHRSCTARPSSTFKAVLNSQLSWTAAGSGQLHSGWPQKRRSTFLGACTHTRMHALIFGAKTRAVRCAPRDLSTIIPLPYARALHIDVRAD